MRFIRNLLGKSNEDNYKATSGSVVPQTQPPPFSQSNSTMFGKDLEGIVFLVAAACYWLIEVLESKDPATVALSRPLSKAASPTVLRASLAIAPSAKRQADHVRSDVILP
jgi:hypothetical protein